MPCSQKDIADLAGDITSIGRQEGFSFSEIHSYDCGNNFCATALMEAYEITKHTKYLEVALSAADFIIKDLHRTSYKEGFLFSYSPLQGNDTVFNASLRGARLLSFCYHYTSKEEYRKLAVQTYTGLLFRATKRRCLGIWNVARTELGG